MRVAMFMRDCTMRYNVSNSRTNTARDGTYTRDSFVNLLDLVFICDVDISEKVSDVALQKSQDQLNTK
jgi:hypothetical protein